jgi:hypothetical protein
VDPVRRPQGARVVLESGHQGPDIGRFPAAGQGDVRPEAPPGIRWRRTRLPGCRHHRAGDLLQRLLVALYPRPQHACPRSGREGTAAGGPQTGTGMPGGLAEPDREPCRSLVVHLTEEGQRDVPRLTAGPAQVGTGNSQGGKHAFELAKRERRRGEGDEQSHLIMRTRTCRGPHLGPRGTPAGRSRRRLQQRGWPQVVPDPHAEAMGEHERDHGSGDRRDDPARDQARPRPESLADPAHQR